MEPTFNFEGEFTPYTMEDLKKDKPEFYALVEEFYALEKETNLLGKDIQKKYNSLYEDTLNIADIIDYMGVSVYRNTIDEVRSSIAERKKLIEDTKEKLAALDRTLLEAYCRFKDSQPLDVGNGESLTVSELCRSGIIRGGDIECLSADTLTKINKEFDNDIDEAQIKGFINQEEVLRGEDEKRRKIFIKKREQEERSNIIKELSGDLEVSREIAKRMGFREITNANSLSNFSFEDLVIVKGKKEELLKLGKEYGGIDLYNRQDMELLMGELFKDKK